MLNQIDDSYGGATGELDHVAFCVMLYRVYLVNSTHNERIFALVRRLLDKLSGPGTAPEEQRSALLMPYLLVKECGPLIDEAMKDGGLLARVTGKIMARERRFTKRSFAEALKTKRDAFVGRVRHRKVRKDFKVPRGPNKKKKRCRNQLDNKKQIGCLKRGAGQAGIVFIRAAEAEAGESLTDDHPILSPPKHHKKGEKKETSKKAADDDPAHLIPSDTESDVP